MQGSHSPLEYATEIAKEADQYNGFNLILADVNSGTMVYISNRPGGDPVIQTVAPGLHVLSNGAIDSPWPKVRRTFILCRYYDQECDYFFEVIKHLRDEILLCTSYCRHACPGAVVISIATSLLIPHQFIMETAP